MLECVINVSEGRRDDVLTALTSAAGPDLLDLHRDADHHRSVLTTVGEAAARAIARVAVDRIDLRDHAGAHPRFGVVDVVPFVPLDGSTMADAIAARDRFCAWAADELGVRRFRYGPERSLPTVRREAFTGLAPATGPAEPHPSAGAIAVGARPVLLAYNLWLRDPDLAQAKRIAADLRSPAVRALGLAVGPQVQVSMNLVDPTTTGPAAVYDAVAERAEIERAELVGLVSNSVLDDVDPARWATLDLGPDRTIEARLGKRG